MINASGRSARILAQTKAAVSLAKDCPCGQEVLAQMLAAQTLKGLEIDLCRKAVRTEWFRLLLSCGVIASNGPGKRQIVVVYETPILMAAARWQREQLEMRKT